MFEEGVSPLVGVASQLLLSLQSPVAEVDTLLQQEP